MTDGTAAGTVRVKDIRPGPESSGVHELTDLGGILMFAAYDFEELFGSTDLWRSDGTEAGTVLVKDIAPGPASGISTLYSTALLTPAGNLVYFEASDGSGIELWRSDGTTAGTVRVADLNPGVADSLPAPLAVANGMLFFGADTPHIGRELWALPRAHRHASRRGSPS